MKLWFAEMENVFYGGIECCCGEFGSLADSYRGVFFFYVMLDINHVFCM